MLRYILILVVCTLAGYVLAELFMTTQGAAAGAIKGFFVGMLVAWGEWKSVHSSTAEEEGVRAH